MKIKDYPDTDRPRERLLKLGPTALSDSELLSIVIQKGYGSRNVLEISADVLSRYGIENLPFMSLEELSKIYGIGKVKSLQIQAMFELSRRYDKSRHSRIIHTIRSPKDVYKIMKHEIAEQKKEHFYCLLLDSINHLISTELISIGTLNASIIHPREIFLPAIRKSANAIILVHNHPSGNLEPSTEDFDVTTKVKEAGKMLGISVLDHVIITDCGYVSV